MSLKKEQARNLLEILRKDILSPEASEVLIRRCLPELGSEGRLWEFLQEKIQAEKLLAAAESQEKWFQGISWWFAKLFMWGTFAFAVVLGTMLGRPAVDPLTIGIIGAATYYVLIQVFTPMRLRRQKNDLLRARRDAENRLQDKLRELEKEFLDPC